VTEKPDNGRTHEPNLREITKELDGLRGLMNERDRWYTERDKWAKDAVAVAEANSDKWRANANEWRESMKDREEKFAQQAWVRTELSSVQREIAGLRESRSEGVGGKAALAALGGLIGLLLGVGAFLLKFWGR